MIKHSFLVIGLLLLLSVCSFAQQPVAWTFSSKKITANKFEIQLTATIQKGWHVYASRQPEDAIALPTTVTFRGNPLLKLTGLLREEGQLTKVKEESLGIEAWQYADKLRYVQVVESLKNAKTNINGTVQFQACTESKCLAPETVHFQIVVE
jgi:thiol:disulfide interchange protein DsbD